MRTVGVWIGCAAAAAALCTIGAKPAGGEAGEASLIEIIVTAPRDLSVLGTTVAEITQADMQAQHAQTVADALEFVPGLDVRVGGTGQSYLRLRGLRQRELLVLLDGIPLGFPYDGSVDLSQIPIDAIQSIRVVAGAPSAMYGPEGMGGVVSIITRASSRKATAGSTFEIGESDRWLTGTVLSGPNDDAGYLLALRRTDLSGFRLSDDFAPGINENGGLRDNAWRRGDNVFLKVESPPRAGGRGAFLAGRLSAEFAIPPEVGDPTPKYQRYDNYDRWLWGGWWERSVRGGGTFKGNLYHLRHDTLQRGFDDATMTSQTQPGSLTLDADDRTSGATLGWRFPRRSGTLKAGLTARLDSRSQLGFTIKRSGDGTRRISLDDHFATATYSLNAEWERTLSSATGVVVGISRARFETRDLASRPEAGDRTLWLPQAALVHRPRRGSLWRFAVGRKARFPNLRELGDAQSGNPSLRPQTSRNLEVGFEHSIGSRRLSVVAFDSRLHDLINRRGKNQPYENIDAARIGGVEITYRAPLARRASACLGYAYLRTRDLSSAPELPVLQYRPNHVWIADLRWRDSSGCRASLVGKYVTSQVYYDRRAHSAGRISPYLLVNCRLSRLIRGLGEAYVAVDNVLDRNYQKSAGQPRPGRTIWFGLARGAAAQ